MSVAVQQMVSGREEELGEIFRTMQSMLEWNNYARCGEGVVIIIQQSLQYYDPLSSSRLLSMVLKLQYSN